MMADNLSSINGELANAICRLSTGGGNAKRELYTDGEEYIIEAKRPFVINGINIPTNRQDLLERSLLIELRPIPEQERKPVDRLQVDFEASRPKLLGTLLDGVVAGLRNLEKVRSSTKTLPRMADFALFAAAAMPAWGWKSEEFLEAYAERQSRLVEDAGNSDAVLVAIRDWIQGQRVQKFEGTSSSLLGLLKYFRQSETSTPGWIKEVGWPVEPSQLSRRIRAGSVGLRAMGVGFEEAGSTKLKLVRLWWGEKPSFENKPLSPEMEKLLREDADTRSLK
jgi:hypothetical protein